MSHLNLPPYDLGLTETEAQARFEELQKRLGPLWQSMRAMTDDEQTIVVAPSMTIDTVWEGSQQKAYEERFLFLLLLLRQPRARLIYVTSQPIDPAIIDYYLHLLPGVIASHGRRRLFLVSPQDATFAPLSQKLLERPAIIRRIQSLIPDRHRAHLVPYNTTNLERDLALALDIPMYGADPKFFPLGTKSGCRRIFAEEGVPHPIGTENLNSLDQVVRALIAMRAQKPGIRQAMVKLNEGVSGEGNALVKLDTLPAPGAPGEAEHVLECVREMGLEDADATFNGYIAKLEQRGGVVEERIMGEEFRSPSVQLRVTPLGDVEILSTHDQVLGGPSGQSYLGCRFPADTDYAPAITREAAKVGQRLAKEGVLGRFALDFVAARSPGGEWDVNAIEINLRKGGTTHPFLTLQFLTDGKYDAGTGVYRTALGRQKCFVASDHLENAAYRVFTPDDLFDIVSRHGIHFDQTHEVGVTFHMMSALGDSGFTGLTAVGNDHAHADELYKQAIAILDEEARLALRR